MKKRGFTLIELLAVIVILAVIALIATPLIMNVINDAKKNSFKDSAYGIMKAIELKVMSPGNQQIRVQLPVKVDLTSDFLEYKGSKPKSGWITAEANGTVALYMCDDGYCATNEDINGNYTKEIRVVSDSAEVNAIQQKINAIATDNRYSTLDNS